MSHIEMEYCLLKILYDTSVLSLARANENFNFNKFLLLSICFKF